MPCSAATLDALTSTARELILTFWPDRFVDTELGDDVALGEDGLGLDSIELAEVVLACEERTGFSVTEELFAEPSLTIRTLAEHLGAS